MVTISRIFRTLPVAACLCVLPVSAIARQSGEPSKDPPAPKQQDPKNQGDDLTNPLTGSKPAAPAKQDQPAAKPGVEAPKADADKGPKLDTKDWKSIETAGLTFKAPPTWVVETPAKSMFTPAAQLKLPGKDGKGDGVLKVFSGIQGGVEPNISRWIGQVQNPVGEPKRETLDIGGIKVHQVEVTGTFSAGMMGQGGGAQKETTLLGAIAVIPTGDIQFKLTGPKDTVAANRAQWDAMIRSIAAAN